MYEHNPYFGRKNRKLTSRPLGPFKSGGQRLNAGASDTRIHHMKTASVGDLRYRFSEVEAWLREGEEIEVTKRRRVIARLVPVKPLRPRAYPDFLAVQKEIFGDKVLNSSRSELVSLSRGKN